MNTTLVVILLGLLHGSWFQ